MNTIQKLRECFALADDAMCEVDQYRDEEVPAYMHNAWDAFQPLYSQGMETLRRFESAQDVLAGALTYLETCEEPNVPDAFKVGLLTEAIKTALKRMG